VKPIKISEVEHLAHQLARKHMTWDEPIPDFSTRYNGILESCLATIFQTYGGKDLYRSLADKAATLFYLMIKNHPFLNGNKRIAVTTLLVFLSINGKWLKVRGESLYELAVEVAGSNPKYRESVVKEIKKFILAGMEMQE
jgi:death-on-curing family protein